jgi:hypothetical protein
MNHPEIAARSVRHAGPNLGMVALMFTILFSAGLYPVTVFAGKPYFPAPTASLDTIVLGSPG